MSVFWNHKVYKEIKNTDYPSAGAVSVAMDKQLGTVYKQIKNTDFPSAGAVSVSMDEKLGTCPKAYSTHPALKSQSANFV